MYKKSKRSNKRTKRSVGKRSIGKRGSKRTKRSIGKRSNKRNSVKKYTGLLGDRCPWGSSVNEAENDKKQSSERWDLQCYKNCEMFESTKDYYNDPDPRLKGMSAARVCGGDIGNPRREPVSR